MQLLIRSPAVRRIPLTRKHQESKNQKKKTLRIVEEAKTHIFFKLWVGDQTALSRLVGVTEMKLLAFLCPTACKLQPASYH